MSLARRTGKQQRGASRSMQESRHSMLSANVAQPLLKSLKVLVVMFMFSVLAFGAFLLAPKMSPEIEQVVLEGDYQWLEETELRQAIYQNLDHGILQLEIDRLRDEIEQVPWVEQAEVVREFPATLVVRISEQQAIAQWNDQGYISRRGKFIASDIFENLQHLPKLSSENMSDTPGQGSSQAIELYHLLSSAVLVSGESIQSLRSNRAGGWSMQWHSGLTINLGRADHLNRTRHALAAWRRLPSELKQEMLEIDARYDNGVAIRTGSPMDSGIEVVTEQISRINLAKSQI